MIAVDHIDKNGVTKVVEAAEKLPQPEATEDTKNKKNPKKTQE